MATFEEALAAALDHRGAGRLNEAQSVCRQFLGAEPGHPVIWHLLGVLAAEAGQPTESVECLQRAIELEPNWVEAHINLGNAWQVKGNLDAAIASYRRAIE